MPVFEGPEPDRDDSEEQADSIEFEIAVSKHANAICAEIAKIKKELLSPFESVLYVKFGMKRQIFFTTDTYEYVEGIVRMYPDIGTDELEYWTSFPPNPAAYVFRGSTQIFERPNSIDILKESESGRQQIRMIMDWERVEEFQEEFPDLLERETEIMREVLIVYANEMKNVSYIRELLATVLQNGALEESAQVIEDFIATAQSSLIQNTDDLFEKDILKKFQEERRRQRMAIKFMEATSVHPNQINDLAELHRAIGKTEKTDSQVSMYCQYLLSLHPRASKSIKHNIVLNLSFNPREEISNTAKRVLQRMNQEERVIS